MEGLRTSRASLAHHVMLAGTNRTPCEPGRKGAGVWTPCALTISEVPIGVDLIKNFFREAAVFDMGPAQVTLDRSNDDDIEEQGVSVCTSSLKEVPHVTRMTFSPSHIAKEISDLRSAVLRPLRSDLFIEVRRTNTRDLKT